MATARSGELQALAQRVADGLPAAVEEVVLTGSTSRGVADELSDVELFLVAEELPPLDDCVRIAGDGGLSGVETWTPPGAPVHWSGGFVDGEFVELIWWPRGHVEERLRAILAAEVFDHQRVRTAEALWNGVCLRGSGLAGWRTRLAAYPDRLAARIVADAAETWHEHPRSELALLRPGDVLALAQRLVEDAENVLRIVFALNRVWEPGWKRVARAVDPLAVKPARVTQRIDAALSGLDLRAMRELVRDTLALAPDTPEVRRARERVEAFLG